MQTINEVRPLTSFTIEYINRDIDGERYKDSAPISYREDIFNPSEIVAPYKYIIIKFDYPIEGEIYRTYTTNNPNGFTRDRFYTCIRRCYSHIYKHMDKYGVWGHSIDDLVIEKVQKLRRKDPIYSLEIGS